MDGRLEAGWRRMARPFRGRVGGDVGRALRRTLAEPPARAVPRARDDRPQRCDPVPRQQRLRRVGCTDSARRSDVPAGRSGACRSETTIRFRMS